LPNVYDPQQLNRYAFERNNPWKYVEESGHYIKEIGLIVGGWIIRNLPGAIGSGIRKLISYFETEKGGPEPEPKEPPTPQPPSEMHAADSELAKAHEKAMANANKAQKATTKIQATEVNPPSSETKKNKEKKESDIMGEKKKDLNKEFNPNQDLSTQRIQETGGEGSTTGGGGSTTGGSKCSVTCYKDLGCIKVCS